MLEINLGADLQVFADHLRIARHKMNGAGKSKILIGKMPCSTRKIKACLVHGKVFHATVQTCSQLQGCTRTYIVFQTETRLKGKSVVEEKMQVMYTRHHGPFFLRTVFPVEEALNISAVPFLIEVNDHSIGGLIVKAVAEIEGLFCSDHSHSEQMLRTGFFGECYGCAYRILSVVLIVFIVTVIPQRIEHLRKILIGRTTQGNDGLQVGCTVQKQSVCDSSNAHPHRKFILKMERIAFPVVLYQTISSQTKQGECSCFTCGQNHIQAQILKHRNSVSCQIDAYLIEQGKSGIPVIEKITAGVSFFKRTFKCNVCSQYAQLKRIFASVGVSFSQMNIKDP